MFLICQGNAIFDPWKTILKTVKVLGALIESHVFSNSYFLFYERRGKHRHLHCIQCARADDNGDEYAPEVARTTMLMTRSGKNNDAEDVAGPAVWLSKHVQGVELNKFDLWGTGQDMCRTELLTQTGEQGGRGLHSWESKWFAFHSLNQPMYNKFRTHVSK